MKQEQLEHLYEIGNKETRKYLETELNYERPFKVGDFVAVKDCKIFGIITSFKNGNTYFSGINYKGELVGDDWFVSSIQYFHHPTDKEIEQHLIKVAELKGYKEGVEVKHLYSNDSSVLNGGFLYSSNSLLAKTEDGYTAIWRKSDNTWAKIIEPKKWTYTQVLTKGYWIVTDGKDEYIFGNNEKTAKDICEYLNNREKGKFRILREKNGNK